MRSSVPSRRSTIAAAHAVAASSPATPNAAPRSRLPPRSGGTTVWSGCSTPQATPAARNGSHGARPPAPLVCSTLPRIPASASAAATDSIPSSATAMITRFATPGMDARGTTLTAVSIAAAARRAPAGVRLASAATGTPAACSSRPSACATAPAPTMPTVPAASRITGPPL